MLCIGGGEGVQRIGDISLTEVSLNIMPDIRIGGFWGSQI